MMLGISFFFLEIFTFLYYANEENDEKCSSFLIEKFGVENVID